MRLPAGSVRSSTGRCPAEYDDLLGRADDVRRLRWIESTSEAHMDASRIMFAAADRLLAVWDGRPAHGYGGTADVVNLAQEQGIPGDGDLAWRRSP